MTILLIEGFDLYANSGVEGASTNWTMSDSTEVTIVPGRDGTRNAIHIDGYGGSFSNMEVTKTLPAITNTITVGAALKPMGVMGNRSPLMLFKLNGTSQCTLSRSGSGTIDVRNGTIDGTIIASTSEVLDANTWNYVEASITVANTGNIAIYINGVEALNITGIDTQASSSNGINQIGFAGNYQYGIEVDDVYVKDDLVPLGDSKVIALSPTADSDDKDFTASTGTDNFAMVNDEEFNPLTYVSAYTTGAKDLYTMSSMEFSPETIHAVAVASWMKKDDVGFKVVRNVLQSGAVETTGSNVGLSSSYKKIQTVHEVDPATTFAWSNVAVASIKAGVEITVGTPEVVISSDFSSDAIAVGMPTGWTDRWGSTLYVYTEMAATTWPNNVSGKALLYSKEGGKERFISFDALEPTSEVVELVAYHAIGNNLAGTDIESGPAIMGSGVSESLNDADCYVMTMTADGSNNRRFALGKVVNNVSTILQVSSGGVSHEWTQDIFYAMRMRYDPGSGLLQGRWWNPSGAEPETWQLEVNDTSVPTPGRVGLLQYGGGFSSYLGYIAVATGGASAALPS